MKIPNSIKKPGELKRYFVFFGPPGSGKGTQTDMLGKRLGLPVVSPGELLRYEEDHKTVLGKRVSAMIDTGKLVPDRVVEKLIDARLDKKDARNGFILDGYPRDHHQLSYLEKRFKKIAGPGDKIFTFLIHISDAEVKRRLGGRRVCDCGAAYHLKYNPPKKKGICDLCGAKIYTRHDDTPEIMAKRLKLYHKQTELLTRHYEKIGRISKIDGRKSIKDIHKDIIKILK